MKNPEPLARVLATILLALAPAFPLAGCRAGGAALAGPTDECPVCKHEGDLACLRVRVTADTPSCTCDGRVLHFCSEECRQSFLADPERYSER